MPCLHTLLSKVIMVLSHDIIENTSKIGILSKDAFCENLLEVELLVPPMEGSNTNILM